MYYSGNRYLTHDEMKVNAVYIYDYLKQQGWTINAIAGLLGNMETESTMNPAIWQSLNVGNLSGGYGLVQWTPATKFLDWASANNLSPLEMNSNLLRIIYEVNNNIQWGNDGDGNHPPYSFLGFTKSTENPFTLGMNFLWYYERPLVKNQTNRGDQATFWFTYLGGLLPKKQKHSKSYLYATRRLLIK